MSEMREAPIIEDVGDLDPIALEEAALALMQMRGGPGAPRREEAWVAIETYLRTVRIRGARDMKAAEAEEQGPVAWMVKHGDYVELWTHRRKQSAVDQVESLREAYPGDEVTLTPLYRRQERIATEQEQGDG